MIYKARHLLFSLLIVCAALLAQYIPLKSQTTNISGIINSYAKVSSIDYCGRKISVESSVGFLAGDRALLIQMKGAIQDSSSTDSSVYGKIYNYGTTGNFEFVTIESVATSSIFIREILTRNYEPASGVQLVKMPKYVTAIVSGVLTCPPWNGATGGIIALEATGAIDMQGGAIEASGKGFRGGRTNSTRTMLSDIFDMNARYESGRSGEKGESITEYYFERQAGRSAIANGGGGGNALGSGGGGGGNGGNGGNGSGEYEGSHGLPFGGIGGHNLVFSNGITRAFMGGGGGGGHQNVNNGSDGGRGGGIVILKTNVFVGRGNPIYADGISAANSDASGAGGGGAGGTVIIEADVFASYPAVYARGGNGGNSIANEQYGTGGGGGGGFICYSLSADEDSIHVKIEGGHAGISSVSNTPRNASNGSNGSVQRGCVVPINPIAGLTAATISDTSVCYGSAVRLDATPFGGRPPYRFRWEPAAIASNPNAKTTSAILTKETEFRVTITDSLGCQTEGRFVARIFDAPTVFAGNDAGVCQGGSVALHGSGRGRFHWSPEVGLSSTNSPSTIATPLQTTTYTLTLTDDNGCTATDSVTITVNSPPTVSLPASASVCIGGSINITANVTGGKPPYSYAWSPNIGSGPTVTAHPESAARYDVTVSDANGCENNASIIITIAPTPEANAGSDQTICAGDTTRLQGSGGVRRKWQPNSGIDDVLSDNPKAFPQQTTSYILETESAEGCTNKDTVTITVLPAPAKPTITQHDDTLFCSAAESYQWLYYGVSLPGESGQMLIVQQAGKYSVSTRQGICTAVSDPIDVIIGQATLCMDSYDGDPGNVVEMEIRLCNPELVVESKAKEIETYLMFNASLLLPLDDFYLDNSVVSGTRILHLKMPISPGTPTSLKKLRFRVGLGNDTVTDIRMYEYRSLGGKIRLESKPGKFYLSGICNEGGARVWRSGISTSLLAVSPQPAEDVIRVDYQLAAATSVEWSLTDYLGRRIFTEKQTVKTAGFNTSLLELSNLPRGIYQLRLDTGAKSAVMPIVLQ